MRRSAFVSTVLASCFALGLPPLAHAGWPNFSIVSDQFGANEKPAVMGDGVGSSACTDMQGGLIGTFFLNTEIHVNRLDENGSRLWGSTGVTMATSADHARVVSDGSGGAWVVWSRSGSILNGLFAQRLDASGAEQLTAGGIQVATNITSLGNTDIAIDVTPTHKLLVAWWDGTGLRVQRVSLTGALDFTASGRLMTSDTGPHTLGLMANGEGGVVVWSSARATLPGPAGATRIVANRFSSTGAPQWTAEGAVVQAGAGVSATGPRAIWTGTELIVTWQHATAPLSIHAQALDLNGAALWGATTTGLTVTTTPNTPWDVGGSTQPQIVSDESGGCVIGWQDFRDFNRASPLGDIHREDVYAQRLNASGGVLWTANGAPVDTSARTQAALRMCSDGGGGAFFADTYDNQHGLDLEATHLNGSAVRLHQDFLNGGGNGVLIEELGPVLQEDDGGGFFAIWDHQPSNGATDCWASHRGADGLGYTANITVTYPNGGESFTSMEPVNTTWTANLAAPIHLEYQSGVAAPVTISAGTTNPGSFKWIVPALNSNAMRIIASDAADGSPTDKSDANFSVCTSLSTPVSYAAGTSNKAIVSGDFNEDGIADLAVTSNDGVSVLLGHGSGGVGNGAFAAPVTYAVSSAAVGLAVGDFNADGRLDLAYSNAFNVGILLGNGTGSVGDGTFSPGDTHTVGANPGNLIVADLDRDGILDIAIVNRNSNFVSILIGQGSFGVGDGTFATPIPQYSTGTSPLTLVAGDFNEDGTPDLAVTTSNADGNTLSILLGVRSSGHSSGTFAAPVNYPASPGARSIATGDFDEDGITDLAITTSAGIAVMLGQGSGSVGDGTFAAPVFTTGAVSGAWLAVCDLNHDGRADILTAAGLELQGCYGDGSGTTGDGTFTSGGFVSLNSEAGLVTGDFNEDGAMDAAVSTTGSTLAVFLGGCPPTLPVSLSMTLPPIGSVLTVGPTRTTTVQWTKGAGVMEADLELSRDGGANWSKVATHLTGTSYSWVVAGPTTTQARFRVVDSAVPTRVGAMGGNFTICGALGAATVYASGVGTVSPVRADFDQNGIDDLAFADDDGVSVLLGLGSGGVGNGQFGAAQHYSLGGPISKIAAADFDDDGILDLAFQGEGRMGVVRGTGSGGVGDGGFGTYQTVAVAGTSFGIRMAVGDLNEDGIPDVVGTSDASLAVCLGHGVSGIGDGTLNAPTYYTAATPGNDASGPVLADFNDDGILDVASVTSGLSQHQVAILLGGGAGGVGNGTLGAPSYFSTLSTSINEVQVADFDLDGIYDLAVAVPAQRVVLLKGNGTAGVGNGTFGSAIFVPAPITVYNLAIADFNQDGYPDLACQTVNQTVTTLLRAAASTLQTDSFEPSDSQSGVTTASSILAGDFDENGRADVVDANALTSSSLAVMLGPCPATALATYSAVVPGGGQVWLTGTNQTISWSGSTTSGPVTIEVSRDSGTHWETIATNVLGPPFVWTVTPQVTHHARIRVRNMVLASNPGASTSDFLIVSSLVGAGPERMPSNLALSPPSPNPSAGLVNFELALPYSASVEAGVYDVSGRRIRALLHGTLSAGRHEIAWDGRDESGEAAAAGLYFVKATGPGWSETRRVMRLR